MTIFSQGAAATQLLAAADWETNPAKRAEAQVRSNLAAAQQAKAANIMAYLAADKSSWPETTHESVRAYLGLPPLKAAA